MFSFFLRTIWRLVVLALGIVLAYVSAFVLYPYLDARIPLVITVFIIYCFVAYLGIPFIIRIWRLVFKPKHIPLYATTGDGWPADPVNIAVIARSKRHLAKSMKRAGWYQADKNSLRNNLREAYALLFNKPYPNAPFSKLYLFGRKFDIGFQVPYDKNKSPRKRHHVRFWQLGVKESGSHRHEAFWVKLLKQFFGYEKTVWVGTAIDDVDIKGIRWRNLQLTHSVHSEHYRERDYIISTLKQQSLVKKVYAVKSGEPFTMRGESFGTDFVVDGTLQVIELKAPLAATVEKTFKLE